MRIAAHAFGDNRPARDLLVSPGHSLCVDVVGEVLIPAMALVNGTTITQEDVDSVTYWHVELEGGHDILLAENMPAESYLEMGNRGFFAESGVVDLDASPDAPVVTHADFCRPFHAEGALVEVVRAQLAARAETLGWRLEEQGLGDLHLLVDGVRVEPRVRGLSARFTVPAGAEAVWLVSAPPFPPRSPRLAGSPRPRRVRRRPHSRRRLRRAARRAGGRSPPLRRLPRRRARRRRGSGAGPPAAPGCRRACGRAWTTTFLRVDLAGPALPRWVAPACVSEGSVALCSLVA